MTAAAAVAAARDSLPSPIVSESTRLARNRHAELATKMRASAPSEGRLFRMKAAPGRRKSRAEEAVSAIIS